MRVFKFGGASVKNADAVRNVKTILDLFPGEQIIVVISAMGKTTNALETLVTARQDGNKEDYLRILKDLKQFHLRVVNELIEDAQNEIYHALELEFQSLEQRVQLPINSSYNFEYDQIVSIGEVLSTLIVEAYLRLCCKKSVWIDARGLIRTDSSYREGEVDWEITEANIRKAVNELSNKADLFITQGFIGASEQGTTTTLGREGSDYTAAIFAFCSHAKDVTIWKDVPGMLNADPKYFENTIKLQQISYREAIELAYYGASVIHPKTVKPLQNKNIPLFVKSFVQPNEAGTVIQSSSELDHLIPSFIVKKDQILVSVTPKDFSFIVEKNLSFIFQKLSELGVKMNIMQNSALSFSFLADAEKINLKGVIEAFSTQFEVRYNEQLELVTIRHYDTSTIARVTEGKRIVLEQKTRETARIVQKDLSQL